VRVYVHLAGDWSGCGGQLLVLEANWAFGFSLLPNAVLHVDPELVHDVLRWGCCVNGGPYGDGSGRVVEGGSDEWDLGASGDDEEAGLPILPIAARPFGGHHKGEVVIDMKVGCQLVDQALRLGSVDGNPSKSAEEPGDSGLEETVLGDVGRLDLKEPDHHHEEYEVPVCGVGCSDKNKRCVPWYVTDDSPP